MLASAKSVSLPLKQNTFSWFDMKAITNTLAGIEDNGDMPKIKPGDMSCAAPFTPNTLRLAVVVSPTMQHVTMFDFSLYFLAGLHSASQMSQICLYVFI